MNKNTSNQQPDSAPEISVGDALVIRDSTVKANPAYAYALGHVLRVTNMLGGEIVAESPLRKVKISNSCFEKADLFQKVRGSHFRIQKGDIFRRTEVKSEDPGLNREIGVEMTVAELHPDYIEMDILPVAITVERDDIRRGAFDLFKAMTTEE